MFKNERMPISTENIHEVLCNHCTFKRNIALLKNLENILVAVANLRMSQ